MSGQDIKIATAEGGEFDCYLSLPASGPAPALVIMSTIFGVDEDVRRNADDLADQGFLGAAPDLFWRGDSGPMPRTEAGRSRAAARAKDRAPMIEKGVQDLADVIADLKRRPECNGKVAVVGLCYGGPYAILGPARLGCDAGISFHGTSVEEYLAELGDVHVPLSLHWGDKDRVAPPDVMEKIQAATRDMSNASVTVYPDVLHGYTAPSNEEAWNAEANDDSWGSALEIMNGLRGSGEVAAE